MKASELLVEVVRSLEAQTDESDFHRCPKEVRALLYELDVTQQAPKMLAFRASVAVGRSVRMRQIGQLLETIASLRLPDAEYPVVKP